MQAGKQHLVFCDKGLKGVSEVLGDTDNGGSNRSGVDGAVTICKDSLQLNRDTWQRLCMTLPFMPERQC